MSRRELIRNALGLVGTSVVPKPLLGAALLPDAPHLDAWIDCMLSESFRTVQFEKMEAAFHMAEFVDPRSFDDVFARLVQEFHPLVHTAAQRMAHHASVIHRAMNDDTSWSQMDDSMRQRIDAIIAHMDRFEDMPPATHQQCRNLGAANIQLMQHPKTSHLFSGHGQELHQFIDKNLSDYIHVDVLEGSFKIDDFFIPADFQRFVLDLGARGLHGNNIVSEAMYRELGLDQHFGTYDDFRSAIKESIAAKQRAAEDRTRHQLRECLSDPHLRIVHHPRGGSNLSYGLRESYHILDVTPARERAEYDNPGRDLAQSLLYFYDVHHFSELAKHGIEVLADRSEIHISDPSHALKLLLEDARREKAPTVGRDFL